MKNLLFSTILILTLLIGAVYMDNAHRKSKSNLPHQKVIVVHARGLSYPGIMEYLPYADPNSFVASAAEHNYLQKLEPIINAVTISNIASFETGAPPDEHGIVGHSFGQWEDLELKTISGFSTRFEKESFWELADHNGLNVLNLGALTLHGKYEQHQNVDCLGQGENTRDGSRIQLVPDYDANGRIFYRSISNNPLLDFDKHMLVFKTQTDSNKLFFESPLNGPNGIKAGEWLELKSDSKEKGLEVFRLKWIDTRQDTISLYIRGGFVNRGYPEGFLAEVENDVGGSKGWPNIPAFAQGEVDANTLIEEIREEMKYVMDVFEYATSQKEYDLIVIDYPLMDRYGHSFWQMISSSQAWKKRLLEAYSSMNWDFQKISEYANSKNYKLIIASGHGFSPVSMEVNLDLLLDSIAKNSRSGQTMELLKGIPGKVSAHIYFNPNARERDKETVQHKLNEQLTNLVDPVSGKPVIDRIFPRSEFEKIGMAHPKSGDIFVMLSPGYVFMRKGGLNLPLFSPSLFNGDHGYGLQYDDSFGVVISDPACKACKTTDISSLVLNTLGL